MADRTATLRSILHAAAQVLRCDSVHLARLKEDRQSLVLAIAVTPPKASELEAVESALGFPVSGLEVSLQWRESAVVRAFREQRLIATHDVTEIAGGVVSAEIIGAVRDLIGPRLFGVVPVVGRAGALGVMLVERAGRRGFSAEERDLLLTYAERVGAELESEVLADEASRLERLGQAPAPPPPLLLSCQLGTNGLLRSPDGTPLHALLGIPDAELLCNGEVRRRLQLGEPVAITATAQGAEPRPLRLTLRRGGGPEIMCAVEDLGWSERQRREVLLAREHLRKVLHSVADAILTLDAAGVIQQANDAAAAVLGLPPALLCGRSALDLAATERGRTQLEILQERIRRTGFAERQLRLQRLSSPQPSERSPVPYPPTFPAHLSALLLCDEALQPAGAVWRIADQTERRRREAEQRRLRQKLLQSERLSALGEMAARIAHEVRNPLVSIGAAALVVAEELPVDSPVAGEVRAISAEVRRLDGIITDFLRFARPRRERAAATDVEQVLREVLELLRQKAGGIDLRLVRPEQGEPAPPAQIDPDGLRQVLWNVLLNACEASRPGGPIECAVRTRPPGDGRSPGAILLTVADRGPGLPPGLRRRVFDPFFSTKARGTGLGLAISKQIIEEHGGRIRLLNRAGGGARVVIELRPAQPAPLEPLHERAPHPDH